MSTTETAKMAAGDRPKPIHTSRSFTRMGPPTSSSLSPRKRASTLQEAGIPAVPEARRVGSAQNLDSKRADVFESREDDIEESEHEDPNSSGPELQLPSTFDELPIEIRSLTERFLENLSAKVHPTPLSADQLSTLFQDFYERAASHIATHIASLASKIGRERSLAHSTGSRAIIGRARAGSGSKRDNITENPSGNGDSGGEMLTASEVTNRRKARRLLELKRVALEEAVERAVCEKVYDRIYKHRSTDDEARDEKLRSRAAALALVGIGLKELHKDSPSNEGARKAAEEREDEIHVSLTPARDAIRRMDDEHSPLGKLQHLKAAHKSIVETLTTLFPSSSSADEILPTLIYVLITSPSEATSVVSNLIFVQRFRASTKVDGEAAYCLVNLEAAISFLETVDLSSLRADELPEGPAKSNSQPSTPGVEQPQPLLPAQARTAQALKPEQSPISVTSTEQSSSPTEAIQSLPMPRTPASAEGSRPSIHQRRISALVQAQADRIEAGRDNILSTADKVYENINNTLENSFQFVFGRFKDQTSGDSPLPKTLEEARKLVSSSGDDDDGASGSGRSSPGFDDPLKTTSGGKVNDAKLLELLGGTRKQLRDRSVDSNRSAGSGGGSGRQVAFVSASSNSTKEKPAEGPPTPSGSNLFTNINPLNRFGMNVPGFGRFARSPSIPTPPTQSALPSPSLPETASSNSKRLDNIVESPGGREDASLLATEKARARDIIVNAAEDDLNAREALAELRRVRPPKKRFLNVGSAAELKIGEVEDLLLEYRRLAKAIGEALAV